MGTSDPVSQRDFSALEKRVSALETSHSREIEQLNKIFVKARDFDDRLDKSITEIENRLRRDMKGLATEKDVREQIDKQVLGKVSEIERLSESRVKSFNTAMEKAKAYDDKLEGMINDLRAKIDRLSRGS